MAQLFLINLMELKILVLRTRNTDLELPVFSSNQTLVRGNISLNDKVVDLIPDLVLNFRWVYIHYISAINIEVGHLLNHTSGLVTNLTGWHYAYDCIIIQNHTYFD